MSVDKFIRDFTKETDNVINQANKAFRNTALEGWNYITSETPVLTGRARASWLLTVDTVSDATKPKVGGTERVYPDPKAPSIKFDVSRNNAMYITSNVEYIEYLEYGTDKFAPFAMVASAVPKIDRSLQRRLKRIK